MKNVTAVAGNFSTSPQQAPAHEMSFDVTADHRDEAPLPELQELKRRLTHVFGPFLWPVPPALAAQLQCQLVGLPDDSVDGPLPAAPPRHAPTSRTLQPSVQGRQPENSAMTTGAMK
jgi:hypothetical protein